jgi:uncharacterized integral membrane protein
LWRFLLPIGLALIVSTVAGIVVFVGIHP